MTVKTGPRHIVRETDNGTFEMIIKSAVRSDAGIYTCKIINEYGTKQCEGKLQVQGMLLFRFLCITYHIISVQLRWLWSLIGTAYFHSFKRPLRALSTIS